MELPQNVLALIKDYSMPLTHPDWRNRKWISISKIYIEAARKKERFDNTNLYIRFLLHLFTFQTPIILLNNNL